MHVSCQYEDKSLPSSDFKPNLAHLIPNHEFEPETPGDSSNRTDCMFCSRKVINLFIG